MRRSVKVIAIFLAVVIGLAGASFIPTLWLETVGMRVVNGEWVTLYYEKEEDAALDVFGVADKRAKELAEKLGFTDRQDIRIYVYDHQSTFQTKKYGLAALVLGLDWYIGDNRGANVLLTSPANPGKEHDYESVKQAVLHEMVHAYVSVINPGTRLWLNEGMALYLSNGEPLTGRTLQSLWVPSYSDTRNSNPIEFANMGGYQYAHTYIEYIDKSYGWDKALELLRSGDYQGVFGKSDNEIYEEWVKYIDKQYRQQS